MGKRKISGLVKLKNKMYLWRKEEDKKGDTIILTVNESRTTQEEQQEMVNAVCSTGFKFKSIWGNNVRFERLGKKGEGIKKVYEEISDTLIKLRKEVK